jgi:hypothetical protein
MEYVVGVGIAAAVGQRYLPDRSAMMSSNRLMREILSVATV